MNVLKAILLITLFSISIFDTAQAVEVKEKTDVPVDGEGKAREGGYVVTGRVLTSHGGKGAKATVTLWHGGDGKTRTTETDADGNYIFKNVKPGEHYYVLNTKNPPGIWTDWSIINVTDKNIEDKDLYLTLSQSLSGIVRDVETSLPVSGAEIEISTDNGRNASSMRTDVDGKFRLYVNQPQVTIKCVGTQDRYYPKKDPREDYRKRFELQPGQNIKDILFSVVSAPKFTGRVLYTDGKPAENIRVDVRLWRSGGKNVPWSFAGAFGFGGGSQLKTDTEGRFIGYLRRPMGMEHWHPNINLKAYVSIPDRSLGGVTYAETTTTSPDIVSMKIVLDKIASATIRIIDPDGNPIENARITVTDNQNVIPFNEVPAEYLGDGRYHVSGLIPGLDNNIAAKADGYRDDFGKAKKLTLKPGVNFDAGTLTMEWLDNQKVPDN